MLAFACVSARSATPLRWSRRSFLRLSAGAIAATTLGACTPARPGGAGSRSTGPALVPPADPIAEAASALNPTWIRRTARGYDPRRSGELQILPLAPNYVGDGLPHAGPWDYTSRVPMFWYGPGFIRPLGVVDERASAADIAPTWAELLGFRLPSTQGRALARVLEPAVRRPEPPRLLVTLVWDGAGRNVLNQWPTAWPNLRSLVPDGAWIEHAESGSSPTNSAPVHATIGTGVFPATHRMVGHRLRVGGGIVMPWNDGPSLLERPTLADRYVEATGGRSVTGMVGSLAIQLGMLGHGSAWAGNERPLAVLRQDPDAKTLGAEYPRWNLPEPLPRWYRFPAYVNGLPGLATYLPALDAADGAADGRWREHGLADDVLQGGFLSPARIPYQTRVVEEVIRREGFGRHDAPDLLFLNYKVIDQVGHTFSMNSREMHDTLRTQDEYLPVLIDILNREVGEERWALLVTADHGSTPDPRISGAFQIPMAGLARSIDEAFGAPVVREVKPTELFVDLEALASVRADLRDVARHVMALTQGDLAGEGASAPSDPGARAFEVAYPSSMLPSLLRRVS